MFHQDGSINAKEVGAFLVGASMYTRTSEDNKSAFSTFDNNLDQREMDGLSDPDAAKAAVAIAKQLLADNGLKVEDGQSNAQFISGMAKNKSVIHRDF